MSQPVPADAIVGAPLSVEMVAAMIGAQATQSGPAVTASGVAADTEADAADAASGCAASARLSPDDALGLAHDTPLL